LDLLHHPTWKFLVQQSIKGDDVSIAGPHPLDQCPSCGNYFIARLPIPSDVYVIPLDDGTVFNRWGFANVLINWDRLVNRSDVHSNFLNQGFEFRLTRTDRPFNETTQQYDEKVVVLAQSDNFDKKDQEVSTALNTTNNEWVMTIRYNDRQQFKGLVIAFTVLISLSIAVLVAVVLIQKQNHNAMLGLAMAQDAKVEVERSMTAYFAHELRNPLSAIDSALQTLPHDDLPHESRDVIAGMQLCSTFMSSIMNNLLDVRKMEEGKLILKSFAFSLQQLVTKTRRMALPTLHSGVELLLQVETSTQDWVLGDEPRIQQILTNIVSNAIKYTKQGSVTIAVCWCGDMVRFECHDTGPGIPKEEQPFMFERFTQRGGAPGSGLGLAISKQMVTLMNGTIGFDSDPTVKPGTTCTVMLPLKLCEEPSEAVFVTDDSQPIPEPLSILLVDDIGMNRAMLKRRLIKGIAPNCKVTEAVNGEQALALCEQQSFDVIVMDQYMEESGGVMVGTDAVIALRRSKVQSLIIGCSGNDVDAQFRAAGADLVWKKPMPSNEVMIQQIRQELRRRRQSWVQQQERPMLPPDCAV
jgi:signal transduction histidine kinase/CheY-like chemotaxis protein